MSVSRNAYTALTPETSEYAMSPINTSGEPQSFRTYGVGHETSVTSRSWAAKSWKAIHDGFARNSGLLLVASSQGFFALMNLAVKKLHSVDPPVSTLELVLIRMAITYACCVVYMLVQKVEDPWLGPKGVRLLLVARGFFGFFGLFGVYYSLQYLSLSDATVLTFLAPLTTAIVSSFVLKESFTLKEGLAGIFSLMGVVLIARPEFIFGIVQNTDNIQISTNDMPLVDLPEKTTSSERLMAVGVALLGVAGSTGAYTTIRAIGHRAHALHSLVSFSSQCVIASAVGMIVTGEQFIIPIQTQWIALLVMIGLFGFVAQVLLTMGLQRETAGRGTMAVYVQVVFVTILDRIFFHSTPSTLSLLGTLIILSSAIYVALTKERQSSTDNRSGSYSQREADIDSAEESLLQHYHAAEEGSILKDGISEIPRGKQEDGAPDYSGEVQLQEVQFIGR